MAKETIIENITNEKRKKKKKKKKELDACRVVGQNRLRLE